MTHKKCNKNRKKARRRKADFVTESHSYLNPSEVTLKNFHKEYLSFDDGQQKGTYS